LFGIDIIRPERLESDYGLGASELDVYKEVARVHDRSLAFCVGATEEVFTQCSQNLFVKRAEPRSEALARPTPPDAWDPRGKLERLFANQFETIQVTVSARGLPGASPRNGDLGKAAFVVRTGDKPVVLIPYYPGNSVHGHAGKLWTNRYGTLLISDDHAAATRVTISGPSHILGHDDVIRKFPELADKTGTGRGSEKRPCILPQYWFLQEVAEIVQQGDPLVRNRLDPQRPTCSISAGGQAKHGKKPAYFAAETLSEYDSHLQHERETMGRPICPSGLSHRGWIESVDTALKARQAHLATLPGA
jgi:hypothetical protein